MSRIGIKPVVIPSGVDISIDSRLLKISGPLGSLSLKLHNTISCQIDGQILSLQLNDKSYCNRKFWGLYRSLVSNAVHGVSVGFVVKVKINGVGYKASLNKNLLFISLGFSHVVCIDVPNDLSITIEEPTLFFIKGIDKQSITTMADRIKMLRFPEPYKGKGIILNDEFVFRKEGKR